MNFAEKLGRLTEGRNKQTVGKDAGLAPTTVSDYISKESSPKADKALALARVLSVPLDWLVDDTRDWPPPTAPAPHLSNVSDRELMMEVASRHRRAVLDFLSALSAAEKINWEKAAAEIERTPAGEEFPEVARRAAIAWMAVNLAFSRMQNGFDLHKLSVLEHGALPGSDRDLSEIEYALTGFPFGNFDDRADVRRFITLANARKDVGISEAAQQLRETEHDLQEYYRRRRAGDHLLPKLPARKSADHSK